MKIKNLLFDLDNTLYPATSLIGENMRKRILSYVSQFLSVSFEEAVKLRESGLTRHGTTLEWLKNECNLLNTKEYFEHVHPKSEIEEVPFDPNLRPFLQELSKDYHLSLLTNAPTIHADNMLTHLNIQDLFGTVYDLEKNNLIGKPIANAYRNPIEVAGFTIEETIFFDDFPSYVKGFTDIGGIGVLMDEKDMYKDLDLKQNGIHKRIHSIYEIPSFIDDFNR